MSREESNDLESIINNLPGMVYRSLYDDKCTVDYMSEQCKTITGYDKKDFIEEPVRIKYGDLILEEDKERLIKGLIEALNNKTIYSLRYRIKTANGKIKWVMEQGKAIYDKEGKIKYIEGYVTDVSDLATTEMEIETLVESSQDVIFRLNHDTIIFHVNRSVKKEFDQSPEDLVGKKIEVLNIPQNEKQRLLDLIEEVKEKKEVVTWEIKKEDETHSAQLIPELSYQLDILRFFLIIRNITDFKQLKIELEESNLELKHEVRKRAENERKLKIKSQELNEFVSFVSHDLNNALAVIDGYINLYLEKGDLELIHTAKKRLHLISELIEKSIKMVEIGMKLTIEENVELDLLINKLAYAIIPKNISFVIDKIDPVSCDIIKISQVITNIFDNAIKHGKPTNIWVKQQLNETEKNIVIGNDGEKISKKVFPALSNKSSTDDGLKVGLPLIKKIIELHGWDISVDSTDKKTEFRIKIPIKKQE